MSDINPEELEKAIERIEDSYANFSRQDPLNEFSRAVDIAMAAARVTLATLPRTKSVERWAVTYWSLTNQTTVCRMAEDEATADRIVEGNGITARKHLLTTREHSDRVPA